MGSGINAPICFQEKEVPQATESIPESSIEILEKEDTQPDERILVPTETDTTSEVAKEIDEPSLPSTEVPTSLSEPDLVPDVEVIGSISNIDVQSKVEEDDIKDKFEHILKDVPVIPQPSAPVEVSSNVVPEEKSLKVEEASGGVVELKNILEGEDTKEVSATEEVKPTLETEATAKSVEEESSGGAVGLRGILSDEKNEE